MEGQMCRVILCTLSKDFHFHKPQMGWGDLADAAFYTALFNIFTACWPHIFTVLNSIGPDKMWQEKSHLSCLYFFPFWHLQRKYPWARSQKTIILFPGLNPVWLLEQWPHALNTCIRHITALGLGFLIWKAGNHLSSQSTVGSIKWHFQENDYPA